MELITLVGAFDILSVIQHSQQSQKQELLLYCYPHFTDVFAAAGREGQEQRGKSEVRLLPLSFSFTDATV